METSLLPGGNILFSQDNSGILASDWLEGISLDRVLTNQRRESQTYPTKTKYRLRGGTSRFNQGCQIGPDFPPNLATGFQLFQAV